MALRERKIPVFVYPSELSYYIDNKKTHTQVLNLYNPYEFPVKYQVLSNTQGKYSVLEPQGTIKPYSLVDLIIKHHVTIPSNCNTKDNFLITMKDASTRELLGKRLVTATLHPGENDSAISHDSKDFDLDPEMYRKREQLPNPNAKKFQIVASAIMVFILLLPTKLDTSPSPYQNVLLPEYFYVSVQLKIVFSFLLGMLTFHLVWG